MKIHRTDAHDRLIHLKQQSDFISQGCQDCINNRPEEFGNHPFYIFAHSRTIEIDERISIFQQDAMASQFDPLYIRKYASMNQVPTHRFIWTPRLTKPIPQSNSMLFKAYPPGDNIKIIWMLPAKELWEQYEKGNLTEHQIVKESIHNFKVNFEQLGSKDDDDLPDAVVDAIYREIAKNRNEPKFEKI